MPLREYRRKRRSGRSPEPAGKQPRRHKDPAGQELSFVIPHHAARSDHHDFRLEIGGVLVSWAIPKGPSTNPKDKRMARRTEDHPLEYATFEGVIPKSERRRPRHRLGPRHIPVKSQPESVLSGRTPADLDDSR